MPIGYAGRRAHSRLNSYAVRCSNSTKHPQVSFGIGFHPPVENDVRCRRTTTIRLCLAWALLLPWMAAAQSGGAPITSAPPAEQRADARVNTRSATLLLGPDAPARRVELALPAAWELAAIKAKNASPAGGARRANPKALAVGFGRALPIAMRTISLASLAWVATEDGGRAARIEIRSPNARALRVAMQFAVTDSGLTVRFAGEGAEAKVFGPISLDVIAQDTAHFGEFWSPVLAGEVATLEFHAAAGMVLDGLQLTLPRVSHQVVRNAELRALSPKTVDEIGLAQSCNIDVACVAPTTALSNAAKSVAQLLFVGEDGGQFLCTGTLLNDVPSTGKPYLFTAAHCMTSAKAARTLDTFWFFDAIACKSNVVPPYVQLTGGAALLGRGQDRDWALVQLNEPPPAGAWRSAWNAVSIPVNAATVTLHHPEGDLKKWTSGYFSRSVVNSDSSVNGAFNEVTYTAGLTEGGSSGAALLTYLDSGGYYEVRGGISEGNTVSCPVTPGDAFDDYSRLEDMLPLTRQYLTPGAPNPSGQAVAVEFYNKTLSHYFLTANPTEIADLDTGVFVGWERTGQRFLTYVNHVAGTNPVCRFYRKPAFGDSHFYSASPVECAETAAKYADEWVYESPAVFYIQLPDAATGGCPIGTQPLWRFFNKVTINHRYTTEMVLRDQMRAKPAVWVPEGYGPDATIMCAASQ